MTETDHKTESEQKPAEPPRPDWRADAKQEAGGEGQVRVLDSSTHNPIAGEYRVGRFDFLHRRIPARPWVAKVFVHTSGRLVEFPRQQQPTVGELLWGGFRAVYEVDMSLRQLNLEITLPSEGGTFVFRAGVDVQWRVDNPKLVVEKGVTDLRTVVIPPLLQGLRQTTRSVRAADVENAEHAANARFGNHWLSAEYGLWTNVLVRLRMDQQKEHNVRLASEVQVFKTLIAGGDLDQFALQLAQNPQEVEPVVQALVRERDTHRREVYDFVSKLLASDALDRCQVDDQVRVTLEWLKVSINRVLSGTDQARQLSFDGGSPHLAAGTNGAGPHADVHMNTPNGGA
jgi:hypothetical protein